MNLTYDDIVENYPRLTVNDGLIRYNTFETWDNHHLAKKWKACSPSKCCCKQFECVQNFTLVEQMDYYIEIGEDEEGMRDVNFQIA